MSGHVLILNDDLMFASRIASHARDVPATVRTVRTSEAALAAARAEPPHCVIVDFQVAGSTLPSLLQGLRELPRKPYVVAYGSHVDAAGLRAAQDAGCDLVLPRSRFVEILPASLPQWLETAS